MPQVSLTTFVDFVVASGTTRLTRVRNAKSQYEEGYGPEKDYYGPMRKRIVAAFEVGWNPDGFDASLDEVDDPKKQENYQRIRRGLRKWAGVRGKRRYVWQTPKRAVWKSNGLTVNIGPELWVDIDGQSYVIKLYFKSDKLSQQKVNLLLHLMQVTIGKNGAVGILDLPQGKLFLQTQDPPDGIDTLLEAEAAAFTVLWDGV